MKISIFVTFLVLSIPSISLAQSKPVIISIEKVCLSQKTSCFVFEESKIQKLNKEFRNNFKSQENTCLVGTTCSAIKKTIRPDYDR